MDRFLNVIFTYLPILLSVIAVILTLLQHKDSKDRDVYFELDNQYNKLLKMALDYPQLRDFANTSEYMKHDKTSTFYIQYNIYAYMVWNMLESIFDQTGEKKAKKDIALNTWLPVIKEENKIHFCWFKHNIHLFKPAFSDFVINKLNNLNIKKCTHLELNTIYPYFEKQFPQSERKSFQQLKSLLHSNNYHLYIAYHNYLPKNENIIGYCMAYSDSETKSIWIDYCAILPGFQSSGYGTTLINKIIDDIGHGTYNTFFEVEIPQDNDENNAQNKRLRFYEKLNCKRLPYTYYLPTPSGKEQLYLFCRPSQRAGIVYKSSVQSLISKALKDIHSDIPHTSSVIAENINNISEDYSYNTEENI